MGTLNGSVIGNVEPTTTETDGGKTAVDGSDYNSLFTFVVYRVVSYIDFSQ